MLFKRTFAILAKKYIIPYAIVVMILNQQLTFFSNVPYLLMKEALSLAP